MFRVLKDEPQHPRAYSLTAEKWESLGGVNVDSKLESFGRKVLHQGGSEGREAAKSMLPCTLN